MNCLTDELPAFGPGPVIWAGAISFESRSIGSALTLIQAKQDAKVAIAFDYATRLSPRDEGEQLRSLSRRNLLQVFGDRLHTHHAHPYRYAEFIGTLQTLFDHSDVCDLHLVLDITCLTRVHAAAVANWLRTTSRSGEITLAYSQPERYGDSSRNIWGKGRWLRTLLQPLDIESNAQYTSTAVVAILGHEGDRMRLAMNEVDPDRGLVIKAVPETESSQRIITVTEVQNAWLRREMENGLRSGFGEVSIPLNQLGKVYEVVSEFCRSARVLGSRVVICPFGPKPFVMSSLLAAIDEHESGAWLAYPIPAAYDASYTQGYSRTYWFTPREIASVSTSKVEARVVDAG